MENGEINIEQKKIDDQSRRDSGEFVPFWENATEVGTVLYPLYEAGERNIKKFEEALDAKNIEGLNRDLICGAITNMAREVYGQEDFKLDDLE